MSTYTIQWYPGHIARAERQLKEQLKRVDVVLEVLDARVPLASHHPDIPQWIGSKPRVLVLNRTDMVPPEVLQNWQTWFVARGETPYLTDAQRGRGIKTLVKATQRAGASVNQRRRDRGMRPRPVRAVVLGFPNVGKSALINRLVGRKVVESARRPGVTRQLKWVRISDEIELLDAPGVIPPRLDDRVAALKLAICEDIGEAAYDNQRVSAAMVEMLAELGEVEVLLSRYGYDPRAMTGESFLHQLARDRYSADIERAARQLLDDFRKGILGPVPLEHPPAIASVGSTRTPLEPASERDY
ncbi:ribosome biogenesis GTP-binding protein YlqF [Rubidibacter lacunae KORDI 51-2]|uniref:Ribosome biogenesis GTPase A n=1 Tax=Rubidibacter lacunae KORDI 51-2 TaxID=582515 RepID=U5D5K4_9CHRO|nr:ribosome biogenesis GTPase YlqF [Rubidibacter lacunae]ERN39953.1 ribosome biogenesis GTP-binding protein YlqF [Rubidibacter lacunae KORDI 51-2]